MIQEIVWKMKMKKWKRNCKKYWICVKNNNYFFLVALKFISLCAFFLTLQNSLQVHILLNYSNFIDTIALLKCIIKRTMLTSTNNCYECIKTEQDWNSNQFAVNASEFSA